MRNFIKEPLFHFIVFGVMIYMASSLWGEQDINSDRNIVISEGRVEHLTTLYTKKWQRKPTQAELENFVQEFVLEDVAYREGVALGIDRNDAVIRRRVQQKLNFIIEDSIKQGEISEDDVLAYYNKNPEMFRAAPEITLKHIYLDPKLQSADMTDRVEKLLDLLAKNPQMDTTHIGDATILDHSYSERTPPELAKIFGRDFSKTVMALEIGQWHGPITSSFGSHLVFIQAHAQGTLPEFTAIEGEIRAELENTLRKEGSQKYYADLLKRYNVIIEWPVDKDKILASNENDEI